MIKAVFKSWFRTSRVSISFYNSVFMDWPFCSLWSVRFRCDNWFCHNYFNVNWCYTSTNECESERERRRKEARVLQMDEHINIKYKLNFIYFVSQYMNVLLFLFCWCKNYTKNKEKSIKKLIDFISNKNLC